MRDFAYPVFDPNHYGSQPDPPSCALTPSSFEWNTGASGNRLSDPGDETGGAWSAAAGTDPARESVIDLDSIAFGWNVPTFNFEFGDVPTPKAKTARQDDREVEEEPGYQNGEKDEKRTTLEWTFPPNLQLEEKKHATMDWAFSPAEPPGPASPKDSVERLPLREIDDGSSGEKVSFSDGLMSSVERLRDDSRQRNPRGSWGVFFRRQEKKSGYEQNFPNPAEGPEHLSSDLEEPLEPRRALANIRRTGVKAAHTSKASLTTGHGRSDTDTPRLKSSLPPVAKRGLEPWRAMAHEHLELWKQLNTSKRQVVDANDNVSRLQRLLDEESLTSDVLQAVKEEALELLEQERNSAKDREKLHERTKAELVQQVEFLLKRANELEATANSAEKPTEIFPTLEEAETERKAREQAEDEARELYETVQPMKGVQTSVLESRGTSARSIGTDDSGFQGDELGPLRTQWFSEKAREHVTPSLHVSGGSLGADAIAAQSSSCYSATKHSAEIPATALNDYELPRMKTIEDLTALMDTQSYFAQQDDVERKVVEACGLANIFTAASDPDVGVIWREDVSTAIFLGGGSEQAFLAEFDARFIGVLHALTILESNGLCADHVEIFIEDSDRGSVITTVGLPIADIRELGEALLPDGADGQRQVQAVYKKAAHILSFFGGCLGTMSNTMPKATLLALTCSLLAISIATFAGSHCSESFLSAQMTPVSALILENQVQLPTKLVVVRKQQLSCLSDFVGGPVWVFGRSYEGPPKMLSISTEQVARLWGPIYAVPSGGDFHQLLALNTDGGIIHHTPFGDGDDPLSDPVNPDEVLMHWTSTSPVHQILDSCGLPSASLGSDSAFPTHLPPYPSHKRLLIGHPESHAIGSCVSLASSKLTLTTRGTVPCSPIQSSHQTSPSMLTASISSLSQHGFRHNVNCALELRTIAERFRSRLNIAGTHNAYYVPEQYHASFSAGQYVNAGVQKSWKRRPASKMKTMLLEYCTKPDADFKILKASLALNIGLEVSICTSNAQRISLWEALQIAFPAQLAGLRAAYAAENSAYLSSYMGYLNHAGTTADKNLSLFWPLGNGLPQVLRVIEDIPEWMALLHDTPESACFAVSSPRCLTYRDADGHTRRGVRSICGTQQPKRNWPVLKTTIDVHPDAAAQLPLAIGARVRVDAGTLEVRNISRQSQLAFFRPRTLLNRVDELRICTLNGQKGHTHRELFDHSGATRCTLPICMGTAARQMPK